jgi:2'-5' RNA ligase
MAVSSDSVNCFIALVPPASIQTQVTAIKTEISQRFHSQAALKSPPHITLQPPFSRSLATLDTLQDGLATFAQTQTAIPIQLSGYKAFAPRVIYIDVVPEARLTACQVALQSTLATSLGLANPQGQRHGFTPHLTVGFRDLTPAAFDQAWAEFKHRSFEARFVAHTLTLLRHDGHRWQILSDFPFRV